MVTLPTLQWCSLWGFLNHLMLLPVFLQVPYGILCHWLIRPTSERGSTFFCFLLQSGVCRQRVSCCILVVLRPPLLWHCTLSGSRRFGYTGVILGLRESVLHCSCEPSAVWRLGRPARQYFAEAGPWSWTRCRHDRFVVKFVISPGVAKWFLKRTLLPSLCSSSVDLVINVILVSPLCLLYSTASNLDGLKRPL